MDKDSDPLLNSKKDNFRKHFRWYLDEGYKFKEIPEEERNYEKAIAFLERAAEELESAEATLKIENYRDTIYHSQRIVELIGKSLLLSSGYAVEEDFKGKIGHRFFQYILKKLRGLLISMSKYLSDSFSEDTIKQIDRYFGDSGDKDTKKKSLEFDNYLEVENTFNEFFSNIEYVSSVLNSIDFIDLTKNGIDETIDIILDEAKHELKRELSDKEIQLFTKVYENSLKKAPPIKTGLNTYIVVMLLFYISFLSMNLEPHFESVRYPDHTAPVYTKDTNLVKNLPVILRLISKIIEVYYYLLSMNLPLG
ncbi:MAG: HEPN domain-containing protein [Asgard group archaeon]|nr:HEPN domain-containing protein [Asgard group archaeon]